MVENKYDYLAMITPQMRKVVQRVENWKKENPMRGAWDSLQGIQEYREWYKEERSWWNQGGPQMAKTEDFDIPGGPNGKVNVRLHYPSTEANLPILVFTHGGGDTCGDNDTHGRIMRLLADITGCCVVGVNYKLAPEAVFPSQVLEVVHTVRYFHEHGAEYGLDGNDISLAGDSAGANSSMATALYLRNEYGDNSYITALLLFYGNYGMRDGVAVRMWGNEFDEIILDRPKMYMNNYTASFIREDQLDSPYYDYTMNNDLGWGIPPAFVCCGEADPCLTGSLTLHTMLQNRGHMTKLRTYPGIMHAFLHYSRMLDVVYDAMWEGAAFIEAARYRKQNK